MLKSIKQHKKAIIYCLGLLLFVPWIFRLNLGNPDEYIYIKNASTFYSSNHSFGFA